jgi:hypothetical protein
MATPTIRFQGGAADRRATTRDHLNDDPSLQRLPGSSSSPFVGGYCHGPQRSYDRQRRDQRGHEPADAPRAVILLGVRVVRHQFAPVFAHWNGSAHLAIAECMVLVLFAVLAVVLGRERIPRPWQHVMVWGGLQSALER